MVKIQSPNYPEPPLVALITFYYLLLYVTRILRTINRNRDLGSKRSHMFSQKNHKDRKGSTRLKGVVASWDRADPQKLRGTSCPILERTRKASGAAGEAHRACTACDLACFLLFGAERPSHFCGTCSIHKLNDKTVILTVG